VITVRLPPSRFALRRDAPKRSDGGKADSTYESKVLERPP